MTREEAILLLHDIKDTYNEIYENYEIGYEQMTALDMAIEALSADRPTGEWILVKGSNGKDYHKCSKCLHTQDITGVKNYCAVCGAEMGGDGE